LVEEGKLLLFMRMVAERAPKSGVRKSQEKKRKDAVTEEQQVPKKRKGDLSEPSSCPFF
jgi:hypothetical protein